MNDEMIESEGVRIEIPSNQPGNNNNVVVQEWEGCLRGNETNKRKRFIQRVPPLLLHGVKRLRNHEYYEPAVVSLGPYHHKSTKLAHNPRRVPLEQRKNNEFLIQQDRGEDMQNGFFNYLKYGEVLIMQDKKVLENKQPLHLLELYRSYFISLSASLGLGSINLSKWRGWAKKLKPSHVDYNYVKRNRSFAFVMELKAKGILLKCTYDESSNEDIKFHSHCCYGELELVRRAVTSSTKAIYLNMIAYEMCPHNPNDFRVSTYIRIMKSLVIQPDDVKELRNSQILVHSLGRDEEVVKMYDEIEAPAVNIYMFNQLRQGIEKYRTNRYRTWASELNTVCFSSPWKVLALVSSTAILVTSLLQTYFASRPTSG
ncbi:UPF0481 protein-like protein [Tanacetum coccineum]